VRSFVYFIPIATTLVALTFAGVLFHRYRERRRPHLLWFAFGALTYAAGTITESATTLFGWHAAIFRAWYITGALLGGAPLAQGTVYLLLSPKTANRLTAIIVPVILTAATLVLLTPLDYAKVVPFHLSGKVIVWSWVRGFSPFINLYAVTFLIGGAILSAVRYRNVPDARGKYIGNILIAIGAILPGIGGTFTRFGHTEVLYVTEFFGILLIWAGYRLNIGATPDLGTRQPAVASSSGMPA
jgi:hypothetical protein